MPRSPGNPRFRPDATCAPAPPGCAARTLNNNGDVEEGGKKETAKSALPFKPLSVAFRDVQYSVPLPKVRRGPRLAMLPCGGCPASSHL